MSGPAVIEAHPGASVIVVTYNDRDRLIDCLRSLEDQTFSPARTEIIVIDDGSTDGTADLVSERFPAVRVIRKNNEGADLSRNRGIAESSGEWIVFIDADCVAPRNWLETLIRNLEEHPSTVVGGRVVHRGPFPRRVVGISDFGEYQGLVRREVRSLPSCNLGLSRSILGDVRFDPRLADAGGDTLFTESLRRGGATLIYEPGVAVEHRPSVTIGDLMRRAGRYGSSFVRARRADPSMRYAGLVRAGVAGVVVVTAARIALDWGRLLRHRRAAGFSFLELPAAAAMLALRRLASLPAAVRAVRR